MSNEIKTEDYEKNIYDLTSENLDNTDDIVVDTSTISSESEYMNIDELTSNEIVDDDKVGKMEEVKTFTPEDQELIIDSVVKLYKNNVLLMYLKENNDISSFITNLFTEDNIPADVLYNHLGKEFVLRECMSRFLGLDPNVLNSNIGDAYSKFQDIINTDDARAEIDRVNKMLEEEAQKNKPASPIVPYVVEKKEDGTYVVTGYTIEDVVNAKIPGVEIIIDDGYYINIGKTLI